MTFSICCRCNHPELKGEHYFDKAHRAYNKAFEMFDQLTTQEGRQQLADEGIAGARKLGQRVLDSDNPYIRDFLEGMRTRSGMSGREALQKFVRRGSGEALGELLEGAATEGAAAVAEEEDIDILLLLLL